MHNNYNRLEIGTESRIVSTGTPTVASNKNEIKKKPLQVTQHHNCISTHKKKPAYFYLWSKSYHVRHKPVRLERFPRNELRKIRFGVYVGHQDERCIYCPFHGIKHGYTLQPTVYCICKFKSLAPSPLRIDITKQLTAPSNTSMKDCEISWKQYNKHIDKIINYTYLNSNNRKI